MFGAVYWIMLLDDVVVGFGDHFYWQLNNEMREKHGFPVPIGTKMVVDHFCILDPYQGQGIAGFYSKMSEYVAKHNNADFIMGETFKEEGGLDTWLKDGWMILGERRAGDDALRVLIGKSLI